MNIDEAIKQLKEIRKSYGNLQLVGGYLTDDTKVEKFIVIDEEGISVEDGGNEKRIEGVFVL